LASSEFYEMSEVCIEAIKMIQKDSVLQEIELQLKQKYPQEEVDLLHFAGQLLDLELIEEIDGVRVQFKPKKQKGLGYERISPGTGKFFFNKFTLFLYPLIFILNISLLIFHPNLFPRYKDLFFVDLMVINIPIWMALTFVLVLIHEMGHILAIRSFNLPTKLEIGHRLFLIVFETDMSAVWKLPSKDRNKLYLAGLCFDTFIIFIAFIGQLTFSIASPMILGILRIIVLDTFIRMVYQLCVYMKTDLYYVIENNTGCYNLMENAQQLLRDYFGLKAKDPAPGEVVFESEKRTVLWYSIFYMVGVALTIFLYLFFYIPQLIYALKRILPGLQATTTSLTFWDSAVFVLQILIGFVLLVYSWIKKYRKLA
jgi:hypothetical protein